MSVIETGAAADKQSIADSEQALLLVYGEGGHAEEMRRLLATMPELSESSLKLLAITEPGAKDICDEVNRFNCAEVRDKQQGLKIVSAVKSVLKLLSLVRMLVKKYDIRFLLTTGPGLAIPVALYAKFKKIHILHVETCCRFYSKSLTGKCMEKLADDFWVQNEELLKIYPDAKWCGRL